MRALTTDEIRDCFVNCTKGEAKRLRIPDLANVPWDDLDFFGWFDPGAPDRKYLVAPTANGAAGLMLRAVEIKQKALRRSMCSLCNTVHGGTGVSLMSARKVGTSGREGNSAGTSICSDLACSLYVRGKRTPASGIRMPETLSTEEQVARLEANLAAFLWRVGVDPTA